MRKLIALLSAVVLVILGISVVSSASADPGYPNLVTYSGQGLNSDGTLQDNRCDDGVAPYLLFVLTANKATAADITLPSGTSSMVQSGNGAFKFMAPYQNASALIGTAVASYNGVKTNAQLVISHGCEGDTTSPPPSPTS
ncbi:hypothetical protein HP550_14765 [Cellulomonas humilata]|uniref:Uncharacterized protein n=1 Tax=Cellulomonas humilata TaxID=144055 RepID=A0A7Y6DXH1_9CELL|nr:hypothetical protein [Cellulomonas humilata]NUU18516.1 hypothetical protein [Cellulomonas humilata]